MSEQVKLTEWTKSALETLRERQGHQTLDSAARELVREYEFSRGVSIAPDEPETNLGADDGD